MSRIQFEQVSFGYGGGIPCIRELSFKISQGELVGLIGANGSGKSTLLRLGCGLLAPTSGKVLLEGRPVSTWKGKQRATMLGYLPQSVELPLPFRVHELVELGAGVRGAEGNDANGDSLSVTEALAVVGLTEYAERQTNHLSGGELHRAFIAMTLAQGGSTLLLDEPLAGLDLRYQHELLLLLQQLCKERNLTILFSLHDLLLARSLQRLLVIRKGQLLADGPPDQVLTSSLVHETFGLSPEFVLPWSQDRIT
jgi:iron complex transport system ATP-binding protein